MCVREHNKVKHEENLTDLDNHGGNVMKLHTRFFLYR